MIKITYYERQIIESGVRIKKSIRVIAKAIGRDHSVIRREIKRNSGNHIPYNAKTAELLSKQRTKQRTLKKLEKDKQLKSYVVKQLREDKSPEQISGCLKKQKEVISVQYERKSQLVRIHKVANKSAKETKSALQETISSLPQYLFKTITFDNGTEGARHMDI